MLLGIFLLDGRRKQIILGIIVDHGLGQYLVLIRVSGCIFQPGIHKRGHLIHIQVNVRDILCLNVFDSIHAIHDTLHQVLYIYCHLYCTFHFPTGHLFPSHHRKQKLMRICCDFFSRIELLYYTTTTLYSFSYYITSISLFFDYALYFSTVMCYIQLADTLLF